VLDAIIDFLPSPLEKLPAEALDEDNKVVHVTPNPDGKLCALAFKVKFFRSFLLTLPRPSFLPKFISSPLSFSALIYTR
jgi:translation elongation factor EF-G